MDMTVEIETEMHLPAGQENFQEADLDLLKKIEGRKIADADLCQ